MRVAVERAGEVALGKLQQLAPVLFPGRKVDFEIADGQPFRLRLLSALASVCGDADAHIPLECEEGVSLGDVDPLSDCVHFPAKSDEADFSADRSVKLDG